MKIYFHFVPPISCLASLGNGNSASRTGRKMKQFIFLPLSIFYLLIMIRPFKRIIVSLNSPNFLCLEFHLHAIKLLWWRDCWISFWFHLYISLDFSAFVSSERLKCLKNSLSSFGSFIAEDFGNISLIIFFDEFESIIRIIISLRS